MRLVVKSKKLQEREVAGSSLENQVHVSPHPIEKILDDVVNYPNPKNFNVRRTKPLGFYTSSAYKIENKMSSEWADFMRSEKFGSFGSIVLLKVNPSARIAIVENSADYEELINKYGINPLAKEGAWATREDRSLNFDNIAKDYDGFRITREGYAEIEHWSYAWDVEQTVWFNKKVLTPIPLKQDSEISAPKGSPQYLDQKYNYISQFDTRMSSWGDY
jgi:hypothetical protein